MDRATAQGILDRISADRAKAGDDGAGAFTNMFQNAGDWLSSTAKSLMPTSSTASLQEAVNRVANEKLRQSAAKDIANASLAAFGVGAAGRGAVGLYNLLRGPKRPATSYGPTELPLPYPAEPEFEAAQTAHQKAYKRPRHRPLKKQAQGGGLVDYGKSLVTGTSATTKPGLSWYLPGLVIGGAGAFGMGWKGMDMILDARRKQERAKQLEEARQQFHDALMSQYRSPRDSMLKNSAEQTPMERAGRGLDQLYDRMTKSANIKQDMTNLGGAGLSAYLLYGGLSSLLAGKVMYDRANKRSNRAVVEEALRRQARQRYETLPSPIMARPEPMVPVEENDSWI